MQQPIVSLFALLVVAAISPAVARGQDVNTKPGMPNCARYVNARNAPHDPRANELADVTVCLAQAHAALTSLDDAPAGIETTRQLILRRIDYKRLKKWIPRRGSRDEALWAGARDQQISTNRILEQALRKQGLFSKFSAVLVSGVSAVDASPVQDADGGTEQASAEATAEGTSGRAVGTVIWQSRHFGEQALNKFGVDWSLGGRIAMQPVLNLTSAKPAADTATGTSTPVTALHQNAFVWTAGPQMHIPLPGIDSEVGIYGSTGSSTLTALSEAIGIGSRAVLAVPLDDGVKRTTWLWETGLTFDIFDNSLEQIHAEGGGTTPQFQALVAVRRDDRFAGRAFGDYARPESRFLFRLTLDALRVLDKRQLGDVSKTFTFGFVVEHERALERRGQLVPAATRFLLRGDLNLLNAISGVTAIAKAGDDKAEAKKADGNSHAWATALPDPRSLTLSTAASSVSVTLKKLTLASGSGSLSTTPPPSLTVKAGAADSFSIPSCPGAALHFALEGTTLRLTTAGWGTCGVASVDLVVDEHVTPGLE